MVVLDSYFVHRTRGLEKKDGNPLNEVRVIVASLLSNGGAVGKDSTIKMDPENSIFGYRVGDKIKITEEDFKELYKAFFAEIEAKFT